MYAHVIRKKIRLSHLVPRSIICFVNNLSWVYLDAVLASSIYFYSSLFSSVSKYIIHPFVKYHARVQRHKYVSSGSTMYLLIHTSTRFSIIMFTSIYIHQVLYYRGKVNSHLASLFVLYSTYSTLLIDYICLMDFTSYDAINYTKLILLKNIFYYTYIIFNLFVFIILSNM